MNYERKGDTTEHVNCKFNMSAKPPESTDCVYI